MQFQRDLDLPSGDERTRLFAELRAVCDETRIAERGSIQDIKELAAQFDRAGFGKRPALGNRRVPGLDAVRAENVSSRVAESAAGGNLKRTGVEPLLGITLRDRLWVPYQIG